VSGNWRVTFRFIDTDVELGLSVSEAAEPPAPPNLYKTATSLWYFEGFPCYPSSTSSNPPTSGSCAYSMDSYAAPLAVMSADVTPYLVTDWQNGG